ncbi:MAG: arsenate reductase ArsC, partial [Acidobacteria bacterium]|nr:arsenate reductase ArsC [Acidobacteriota bacterium]
MARKPFVLFVCSRNSARSQMAEGLLRHLAGDVFDVGSAGIEPGTLNPFAVEALGEIGIDISKHEAKGIREYLGRVLVDHLIIVCDAAAHACPAVWPNMRERHNWPVPDPAAIEGTD